MLRAILAVIIGYAIWTGLWLVGNQGIAWIWPAAVDPDAAAIPTGALHGALGWSVICSLAAGFATAKGQPGKPVLVLGALLLLTGVAVQAGIWERMPLWYHLIFLILLLPATLLGGRQAGRKS